MFTFNKNKYPVFNDTNFQNQLDTNGYIIIPLLDIETTTGLEHFYHSITLAQTTGFEPTTYSQSDEYRIKASTQILNTITPELDKHLIDYKTFMGSFIVKHTDNKSELGVHQDMTLVDESAFMGINVWIPLCDTNINNGALHIIPKSHRIIPSYRAATIPNIYDKHTKEIKKLMQPVYLKAGEAIFFDNSLLHFSPANDSDKTRIACNVFVTHKDAKITTCYHDREKNKIELIEQEDTFFTEYKQFEKDNLLRPKIGRSKGFTDYNFPVLTTTMIKEKCNTDYSEKWTNKLKSIFN